MSHQRFDPVPGSEIGAVLIAYCLHMRNAATVFPSRPAIGEFKSTILFASPYASSLSKTIDAFHELFNGALPEIGIELTSASGYPAAGQISQAGAVVLVFTYTRHEPDLADFVAWSRRQDIREAVAAKSIVALSVIPASQIGRIAEPFRAVPIEKLAPSKPLLIPFALKDDAEADSAGGLPGAPAQRDIAAAMCLAALRNAPVDLVRAAWDLDQALAERLLSESAAAASGSMVRGTAIERAVVRIGSRLRLRRMASAAAAASEGILAAATILTGSPSTEITLQSAARRIVQELNHARHVRNDREPRTPSPPSPLGTVPLAPLQDFRRRALGLLLAMIKNLPSTAEDKRKSLTRVQEFLTQEFPVLVVGMMSSGKSTLINTMLFLSGATTDDALPTSPERTTAVPTILSKGPPAIAVRFFKTIDLDFFGPYDDEQSTNKYPNRLQPLPEHIKAYAAWLEAGIVDPAAGFAELFNASGLGKGPLPNYHVVRRLWHEAARFEELQKSTSFIGMLPVKLQGLPFGVRDLRFNDQAAADADNLLVIARDMTVALRAERIEVSRPFECLDGVRVIDSPGTHSDSRFHSLVSARLLEQLQTGIIIYVMRSDSIGHAGDFQNLEHIFQLRGRDVPIFFAINDVERMDVNAVAETRRMFQKLMQKRFHIEPRVAVINAAEARFHPDLLDWRSFEEDIRSYVKTHATRNLGRSFLHSLRGEFNAMGEWAAKAASQASNVRSRMEYLALRLAAIDRILAATTCSRLTASPLDEVIIMSKGRWPDIVERAVASIPELSFWTFGNSRKEDFLASLRLVVNQFEGIISVLSAAVQHVIDGIRETAQAKAEAIPGGGVFVDRLFVSRDFDPFHYHRVYSETVYTASPWFGWHAGALADLTRRVEIVLREEEKRAAKALKDEVDKAYATVLSWFAAARVECVLEQQQLGADGGPDALAKKAEEWTRFAERWLKELESFDIGDDSNLGEARQP